MHVLQSRFRFHGEYVSALIVLLLACAITLKFIFDPYDKYGKPVNAVMPVLCICLWILFGFLVYSILKIPNIIVSEEGIHFKSIVSKRTIHWKEIDKIDVIAKRFPFWGNPEDASILVLTTGEKVYIRIECYKNGPEIRQLLNEANKLLSENKSVSISAILLRPAKSYDQPIGPHEEFKEFRGTPYFNFNAIIIYGVVFGLLIGTRKATLGRPEILLLLMIPIAASYLGIGLVFNYFLVSDKHLVIRNSFLWWKRRSNTIDEIREVIFFVDNRTKMKPNAMKVITKDFRVKIHPAAGLWARHWKALKQHLESIGIKVTDDIGF